MMHSKLKTATLAAVLGLPGLLVVQTANAKPATLDTQSALATNSVVLTNGTGPFFKAHVTSVVQLEQLTKAAKGHRDALKHLLPDEHQAFPLPTGSVSVRGNGQVMRVKAGKDCDYRLVLNTSNWTPEGLVLVYTPSAKLPKACPAEAPTGATDTLSLTERLVTTPTGAYQLPVAPDGTVVSTVLPPLAPTSAQDAGLYGYTFFVKYPDGQSTNWAKAGILGNSQAKTPSPVTALALIAQIAIHGGERLEDLGIEPAVTSQGQLMMHVVAPGAYACRYEMFLDQSSLRRDAGLLSVDFEAPGTLPAACNGQKAPQSVRLTVEPLDVGPQGSNVLTLSPVSE